ncbi:helix-turn-helix domain-containing protein [Sphingomonas sp. UNC305MFCol5.2]|uniref:helix-turn-helix domain-containing protein n=1 Tax=Sphingomonas sp. UNC305MFCol5.2 TaxID=1449076 RepID=UPI000472BBBE|nr:ImmA/IrrE family metallo-endopeptidase [Sphingomonas sp. UNC305MFCol5.2]
MFSSDRFKVARQRRKLTGKSLAELAGISAVTLSKIENGHQPEPEIAERIARALGYPESFFTMGPADVPEEDTVSFRSLKKMSGAERGAALAAGALGIELYRWIETRFNLPEPDLLDLSKERNRPEVAARILRQHWRVGERPIGDVLKLLESKGIRVLSLSENTRNVDAYSFWYNEHPYVFLNQEKTAERSIFDAAHELGHLVLHCHAGARGERGAEMQADRFASAFLMPHEDIISQLPSSITTSQIIKAKARWKVSAMALAYRLHSLEYLSEWNYRSICIELGQLGYRSGEPVGIERETSTVMAKVLNALWSKRLTKYDIAKDLGVPIDEIETLIFGLTGPSMRASSQGGLSLVRA